jgi:hypothetical protein
MERILEKGAQLANILALIPGGYCAYGTYLLLHGTSQFAQSAPPGTPPAQLFNPVGLYISLGIFVLLVLIGALLNLISKRKAIKPTVAQLSQASGALIPGIPTLSSLLGQPANITFDPKVFFAHAHYSPLTAEVEHNMKVVAAAHYPTDKEGFYARFIGIGMISYVHDETWYTIYGSQLKALDDLNRKGMLPLMEIRAYYDAAVPKFPSLYPKYTFEKWLNYLKERSLIFHHPSEMIEITHMSKDFLKYLTHAGRKIDAKAF